MIDDTVLKAMNLRQIEIEIASNERMLPMLIGWLYPSIIRDELAQLRIRKAELEEIERKQRSE